MGLAHMHVLFSLLSASMQIVVNFFSLKPCLSLFFTFYLRRFWPIARASSMWLPDTSVRAHGLPVYELGDPNVQMVPNGLSLWCY